MIRGGVRGLAEPGRLVTGVLEASERPTGPARLATRSASTALRPLAPRRSRKSSKCPPARSPTAAHLVSHAHPLTIDHPPLDLVYVRWRGTIYGPLRTAATARAEDGNWSVRAEPVPGGQLGLSGTRLGPGQAASKQG